MKKRLEAVIQLVKPNKIVADIGTDHAYVPCELIQKNIAKKCYACDVIEGPLEIAKKHISKRNLEDSVQVILSDGLLSVPQDTEVVVIAGMGFLTAKEILEKGLHLHPNVEQIVIQVNKDVESLRLWISENGFTIEDELLVEEHHFYQIISFNLNNRKAYTEKEIFFGPYLMKRKGNLFEKYFNKKMTEYDEIQKNLDKTSKKSKELNQRIQWIQEELKKPTLNYE